MKGADRTSRRLDQSLRAQEVKGTNKQTRYELQEQKGAKRFFKIAGYTVLGGLVVAGSLYTALHITKGQKDKAVQQVVAQTKTLEQTADDYVAKAVTFMGNGDIAIATDLVSKAENLEAGTQYADLSSKLSKAKDLKEQYNERNDKVKALMAEQKYDLALAILGQDNIYDSNNDKMLYSQRKLAEKMAELGVTVSEHDELDAKVRNLIKVRDEKKALTQQVLATTKKVKDLEYKQTMDDATLDGQVDSTMVIGYRVEPASDVQGARVTIYTKKGKDVVIKGDQEKFLYGLAVKLENIIPGKSFSDRELEKLFKTGEFTKLNIDDNNGMITFSFVDNKRKELTYKVDKQYSASVKGVADELFSYSKGVQK